MSSLLRGLFRRAPPLPEIASFAQHCEYGPASRQHKVYCDLSVKEIFKARDALPASTSESTGLFGYPLLQTPQGFFRAWFLCQAHCDELVKEIVSQEPSAETLRLFDDLSNSICVFADCINFIAGNAPSAQIGEAALNCAMSAQHYVEQLNTNQDLYQALREVSLDRQVVEALGEEDRLALFSLVREMEASGIHLPADQRESYVSLTTQLHRQGSHFSELAHRPVTLAAATLPRAIAPLSGEDLALHGSGSDHFMPDVREFTWTRYHAHSQEREDALVQLLQTRHTMARSVGFPSYAARELGPTMAGNPETVGKFLELLREELAPYVDQEVAHIRYAKAEDCPHSSGEMVVAPWCGKYYPETLNLRYNLENHTVGGLFLDQLELGTVVAAMGAFCEDVLHCSLVVEEAAGGELVHPNLVKMALFEERDGLLGYLYLDLCERPGKDPRTCLHTVTCGTRTQVPVVVLQCGLRSSRDADQFSYPTLSMAEVQTLFHELGHALHGLLGRTSYQHTSGTRGPTDFAEIPSTLLENFICHPRVWYNCISPTTPFSESHFKYGTEHLFNTPYTALEMETGVLHASLDQRLHSSTLLSETGSVARELQERLSSLSYPGDTSWHLRFSHLHFYGARYYSYLWSRSIANLIFYNLFYEDPFNEESGRRLKEFLRRGSSVNYQKSVEQLVGYQFGIEEMVGAIVEPVKSFSRGYLDHQDISDRWW